MSNTTSHRNFLAKKMAKLSAKDNAKLQGELGLRTGELVIKKLISFGGTVELLDANTSQLVGVSSFNGNKLDDAINFIFDKIRIGYSNDVAADLEAELLYATALPVGLRNAQLVISQDNTVISSLPISALWNKNAGATASDDYAPVSEQLLLSHSPISIAIKFPLGVTTPANNNYVEVSLGGSETYKA